MKKKSFSQQAAFSFLLFVLCLFFLIKIWPIRELYLSASTREAVRATLLQLEKNEGWLLSDMKLIAIDADALTILHREHRRGSDPRTCFRVSRTTSQPHPCDAAR